MSQAEPIASSKPLRGRIDLVDLARGLALLAMFVFHFAYDLSYFGLIAVDVATDPAWSAFARMIAGSFLTIVGFSLVLATRDGLNRPAYLRRLAMVAGAAALVTLGTFFAMPQNFIFFGILHHIALASVLGLFFLRLSVPALVLAAAIVFSLSLLPAPALLDRPWLLWLGFATLNRSTADFVPLVPWFGCVLMGMAFGKLAIPHLERWGRWRARASLTRIVAWGGRNSLLVYLAHQPIFIGVLLLATRLAAAPAQEERPFLVSCQRSCVTAETSLEACAKTCACAVEELKKAGLWRKVLANTLSREESMRTGAIAQACFRRP